MIPGGQVDTISVRLLAANGDPVQGYRVQWSGDGQVTPLDSVTDDLGLAHATWTLPRYGTTWVPIPAGPSGEYSVRAVVGDLPAITYRTTARSFTVEQLDAASGFGCGIRSAGLWCWGYRWPVGWTLRRGIPYRVPLPPEMRVTYVQVTDYSLCVLDAGGAPWCSTAYPDPTPLMRVTGVPALATLDRGSGSYLNGTYCGLGLYDTRPWCWQLRHDGTFGTASRAMDVSLVRVDAGADFICGLDAEGAVWCVGENAQGQLGDGTTTASGVPVRVVGLPPVATLSANAYAACAAEQDGTIWCWGFGPHGYASSTPIEVTVPGIRGTNVHVSGTGDGYLLSNGVVTLWWKSSIEDYMFQNARGLSITGISGDSQACLHSTTGEVFCSWILAYGGGDTHIFPSELVPLQPVEP
jgi:hypothetical protein